MAEDEDDFDQHFGGDQPPEEGGDAESEGSEEGGEGGEDGESEEDEEDFSKEWGDLPDDPVKFGGGSGSLKKVIRISLMVLVGAGVPSTVVGVLWATGLWDDMQTWMAAADTPDSIDGDSGKEKKKKKRSRKGKKKKKSKSKSKGKGLAPDDSASGGELVQDWQIDSGEVRVVIKGKAELWVDGVSLGKVKKKKLKLSAGQHIFRAKMGKKKLAVKGKVEEGGNFTLSIDFKKMKTSFGAQGGRKKKR